MTVDFAEHFWGDKHAGFDVLYQNYKCGSVSAKELADFMRNRCMLEEYNLNHLAKLSKKTTNNQSQLGTFQPLWILLRQSTEKLSSLHMQTHQRLSQLIKDIAKYTEDHHKRQKVVKGEEQATVEIISELKEAVSALNKSKEFYYTKTVELERLRKENAPSKDVEKAESRQQKAITEYKSTIDKYNKIKRDMEKKMTSSCRNFQKLERDHLIQMKEYMTTYGNILQSSHALVGQIHNEFQGNCTEMTLDRLMEVFVNSKATGKLRPVDVHFEEINTSNLGHQMNATSCNHAHATSGSRLSSTPPSLHSYPSSSSIGSAAGINNLQQHHQASLSSSTLTNNSHNHSPGVLSSSSLNLNPLALGSGHNSNQITASTFKQPSSLSLQAPPPSQHATNSGDLLNLDLFSSPSSQPPLPALPQQQQQQQHSTPTNANKPYELMFDLMGNQSCVGVTGSPKPSSDLTTSSVSSSGGSGNSLTQGFLKSSKNKSKSSAKLKSSSNLSGDSSAANGFPEVQEPQPNEDFYIDAEGFRVRIDKEDKKKKDKSSGFDNSSSDSDSDGDDGQDSDAETREKKIFVKINPLSQNGGGAAKSGSVDQLIAVAGAIPLAPSAGTSSRRLNMSANPSPVIFTNTSDGTVIKRSVSVTPSSMQNANLRGGQVNDQSDLLSIFGGQPSSLSSSSAGAAKSSNHLDLFAKLNAFPSTSTFSSTNQTLSKSLGMPSSTSTSTTTSSATAAEPVKDRYAALSELFSSSSLTPSTSEGTDNILPLPPKTTTTSNSTAATSEAGQLSPLTTALSKSLSSAQPSFNMNNSSTSSSSALPSVYRPSQSMMMGGQALSKSFAGPMGLNGGGGSASFGAPWGAAPPPPLPTQGSMSRADSVTSLSSSSDFQFSQFRMTPTNHISSSSLCSSRDSSPLTIGLGDSIPVAIAFQESIGACFKGNDEGACRVSVIGCVKMAFSAGIIQAFSTNPALNKLTFKLKNTSKLTKIILSKELVTEISTSPSESCYEMNMPTLQATLRRFHEATPNARYYNMDIFKYQVAPLAGPQQAPLHLVSHWRCEQSVTNLKIDYKYNPRAFEWATATTPTTATVVPLKNVQFKTSISGGVTGMTSQPTGEWDSNTGQASWQLAEISPTSNTVDSLGSIKAKLDLEQGPTMPGSVYVQFSLPDTLLSGVDFELTGPGYRLSLVKKQVFTGRYYCEPKR